PPPLAVTSALTADQALSSAVRLPAVCDPVLITVPSAANASKLKTTPPLSRIFASIAPARKRAASTESVDHAIWPLVGNHCPVSGSPLWMIVGAPSVPSGALITPEITV